MPSWSRKSETNQGTSPKGLSGITECYMGKEYLKVFIIVCNQQFVTQKMKYYLHLILFSNLLLCVWRLMYLQKVVCMYMLQIAPLRLLSLLLGRSLVLQVFLLLLLSTLLFQKLCGNKPISEIEMIAHVQKNNYFHLIHILGNTKSI